MKYFLLLFSLLTSQGALGKEAFPQFLCNQVDLKEAIEPELSDREKTFLCGDPNIPEWEHIPLAQIEFHARAMLQSRGYHFPSFKRDEAKQTVMIDPGEMTKVKDVFIEGSPADSDTEEQVNRSRIVKGHPLTPETLGIVQGSIREQLQRHGYACPRIKVAGTPDIRAIRAELSPGPRYVFPMINTEDIPGLENGVLSRYYPFETGDLFDSSLLSLASLRTESAQIVFNNHFSILCSEQNELNLTHQTMAGGPRLIRLAFGANTEVGPIVRAEWSNTRFGRHSSNFRAAMHLSLRDQGIQTSAQLYYLGDASSRWHLAPRLSIARMDNERIGYFHIDDQLGPSTSWDKGNVRLTGFLGPGTQLIHRLKGVGLERTFVSSLNFEAEALSHELELNQGNPMEGTLAVLKNRNSLDGILSHYNANSLDLRLAHFWNLRRYEPPLWVLIFRTQAATTLTDGEHDSAGLLPLNYRYYLGGAENIRGFGRNEIPLSPLGGLTAVSWSLESRVDIPYVNHLYALTFWDFGCLGKRMASLDSSLYTSPGFGAYWVSPVGVIKATLAHGVTFDQMGSAPVPTHWQFFLAFGEGV